MQGHHGDIIQVIIMQLTRLHTVCNKWVHSSNESLGLQKNNSLRSQLSPKILSLLLTVLGKKTDVMQ